MAPKKESRTRPTFLSRTRVPRAGAGAAYRLALARAGSDSAGQPKKTYSHWRSHAARHDTGLWPAPGMGPRRDAGSENPLLGARNARSTPANTLSPETRWRLRGWQ